MSNVFFLLLLVVDFVYCVVIKVCDKNQRIIKTNQSLNFDTCIQALFLFLYISLPPTHSSTNKSDFHENLVFAEQSVRGRVKLSSYV